MATNIISCLTIDRAHAVDAPAITRLYQNTMRSLTDAQNDECLSFQDELNIKIDHITGPNPASRSLVARHKDDIFGYIFYHKNDAGYRPIINEFCLNTQDASVKEALFARFLRKNPHAVCIRAQHRINEHGFYESLGFSPFDDTHMILNGNALHTQRCEKLLLK